MIQTQITNTDHAYLKSLVDKEKRGYRTITATLESVIEFYRELKSIETKEEVNPNESM